MENRTEIPLHVLVATPSGPGGQGGIDRLMDTLRAELQRRPPAGTELAFAPTRGSGHIALSPLHLGLFLVRMLRDRAAGRLDVVHINLASNGSTYRKLAVAMLARLLGVPTVLHLHGGDYPNFWSTKPTPLSRLIHSMFHEAAAIVVLGRVWQEFVAGRVPEATDRIVVLPNATPRRPHASAGGGKNVHILFLGRVNADKGVPELGDALQRLLELPGWRATIAGDGHVETARQRAVELGLAERVAITGWVDSDEVERLLGSADILVLPSREENLPMSVVEGMAFGLAIVATPVGAVEDIVKHERSGLLVTPGDVDGLTAALRRLIADGELRRRLGAEALEMHRAQLDIEPYAERLVALWQAVARTSGRRRR